METPDLDALAQIERELAKEEVGSKNTTSPAYVVDSSPKSKKIVTEVELKPNMFGNTTPMLAISKLKK